MSVIPIRRRWKEGTYVRLISTEALKRYVVTQQDRERLWKEGKPWSHRKIRQAELARSAGVSRSMISQLVCGDRPGVTPLIAERICDRLDVNLEELFIVHEPRPEALKYMTRSAA